MLARYFDLLEKLLPRTTLSSITQENDVNEDQANFLLTQLDEFIQTHLPEEEKKHYTSKIDGALEAENLEITLLSMVAAFSKIPNANYLFDAWIKQRIAQLFVLKEAPHE